MKLSRPTWWAITCSVLGIAIIAISVSGRSLLQEFAPDRWSQDELELLAGMRLSQLPSLPPDPSNAVADSPAAQELGRRWFFDVRFSRNQAVSCATCHDPNRDFQDDLPLARGIATTTRRTMPLADVARSPWMFWDGRKDSMWAQALGPLEDAREHGGDRTQYFDLVRTAYRTEYENVFGPMPDLSGLPQHASPLGSEQERHAWARLDAAAQQAISRVFANIGKAIAAYERTLHHAPSRFDSYVEGLLSGDRRALNYLSAAEKRGLRLFIGRAECGTCHTGPLFTDQYFHNTAVPPRNPAMPDEGRQAAVAKVAHDEFNCLGPFSDAQPEECSELKYMATDDPAMMGAFKTPSLRNVALRPPYMHAGQIKTLAEVVRHYALAPSAVIGHNERIPLSLSQAQSNDLVQFLQSLSQIQPSSTPRVVAR